MSYLPLIIGLAGGTGSGKTTVTNIILHRVGASKLAYLPHDAYYRNFSDLPKTTHNLINWDHPDSLETELMIEHIRQLKAGQAIERPVYDFTTNARTLETVHVEPHPIVIVEGILIFADPQLRALFDVK